MAAKNLETRLQSAMIEAWEGEKGADASLTCGGGGGPCEEGTAAFRVGFGGADEPVGL